MIWDDDVHVSANALFHPMNAAHLWQIWTQAYQSLFIPVTYSLWGAVVFALQSLGFDSWADSQITGPFLALNLCLHLLNGFLLFRLLSHFFSRREFALLAVLIFLFHPLQVESVASVTGLKEVLWASFALGSMLCALADRPWRMALLAILAMFSLPIAAVLPVILLILTWLHARQEQKSWRPWALRVLPLFAVSLLVLTLTKYFQSDRYIPVALPWDSRLQIVADTFGFYLEKLFWPLALTPDYGRTPLWVQTQGFTLEMGIFLVFSAVLLGLFWRLRRQRGLLLLGLGLVILPLIPASGIVPFLQQNHSTVTDRYLYFSLSGFAFLTAAALQKIPRLAVLIGGVLICFYIFSSFVQTRHWTTNEGLFNYVLQIHPDSFMAENNLGILAAKKGQNEEALSHFERSFALNPRNLLAAENIGTLLIRMNRQNEAVAHFQDWLKIYPEEVKMHLDYALLLSQLKREQEALQEFLKALSLSPQDPVIHVDVGVTLCHLGRCREAIPYFEAAVNSDPSNAEYKEDLRAAQNTP